MMINTISFKIKPSYNFPFRGKKKNNKNAHLLNGRVKYS